jgi:HAD superfamily hydrolase (TIGR01484 family)
MKKLVILDIDGTLIDENYNVNSKEIFRVIEEKKQKGFVFCLNSNRSKEDLIPIYERFNLNGFIIGENGSFSIDPRGYIKRYTRVDKIEKLKEALPNYLRKNFPNSTYLIEDTIDFLKKNKNVPEDIVFLANKFRKYTMSIHIRKKDNGNLIKDESLAKQTAELIKKLVIDLGLDFEVVLSDSMGNVLVMPKDCSKGSTFDKVYKSLMEKYTKIMIGNDSADLSLRRFVDFFYVVGNSSECAKKEADYISKEEYTKGVVDILINKLP